MVELVPITAEHCREVAATLRHPDLASFERAYGTTALDIVEKAVSETQQGWSVIIDGDLVALGGFKFLSMTDNSPTIWFHTCEAVTRHRITFLRAMRQWMFDSLAKYDVIYGYIDTRFKESLAMDKWLGFTEVRKVFVPEIPAEFWLVEKRRDGI